jgi:hypothetical protein
LLTSCEYPLSTNWAFVDKNKVEELLKSPDEFSFDGKKYVVSFNFVNDTIRSGRPGPFVFPTKRKRQIIFLLKIMKLKNFF